MLHYPGRIFASHTGASIAPFRRHRAQMGCLWGAKLLTGGANLVKLVVELEARMTGRSPTASLNPHVVGGCAARIEQPPQLVT